MRTQVIKNNLVRPGSPEMAEADYFRIREPVAPKHDKSAYLNLWIAGNVIAEIG